MPTKKTAIVHICDVPAWLHKALRMKCLREGTDMTKQTKLLWRQYVYPEKEPEEKS